MKQSQLVCYLNFNKHRFFVFIRTRDCFDRGEFLEASSYMRGELILLAEVRKQSKGERIG